jgi:hypothetical protein
MNPLKKWVVSNKYFIKITDTKENKASATHFLLDGGIWKIPKEEYTNFLKLLSTDLLNGEKHYICENRTPIFKFICDLDFYELEPITIPQITIIVREIQNIVEEFYGRQKVIVCGSDNKNCKIEETDVVKSGFHLVWPKIWISTENAKKMRLLFIERLSERFGPRENYNTWSDVVDLAVYEDNGLRMVGCRKMGFCKSCKNKKEFKETCLTCNGSGKIDENRVYSVKSTIDGEIVSNDLYTVLIETSIYNYADIDSTKLLKPIGVELTQTTKVKKNKISENELMTKVENFIKKNFREHYSKIRLNKLKKDSECYYAEPIDNFCMNVNRAHTSSGVYFQIKPSGICQRCFCKKDTLEGRLHGPCNSFSSKEIPISKILNAALFGPSVKKNNKKIVNFNITRNSSTTSLDLSKSETQNVFTNKQICLANCKNILWQLENELKLI